MAPMVPLPTMFPARAVLCRSCLSLSPSLRRRPRSSTRSGFPLPLSLQRRWIGDKYLAKMKVAQGLWDAQAKRIADGRQKHLFDELQDRGFIKDLVGTKELIRETMRRKRVSAYAGIDPTGPSLHLGHLLPLMPLFWMYLHGYGAYTLIGGSTARIGDPTGRTESRPQLPRKELVQNLATIHYQVVSIWKNVEQSASRFGFEKKWEWRRGVVNNNVWWLKRPMLDVVKYMGAHIRMGALLSRDNVKTRLQDGSGMSFAEFCYPMMQAWDWYELLKQQNVQMQIGGSDQYGNILTGAACVKACAENEPDPSSKLPNGEFDQPIGFTVPLLTDSSGAKFGKSAGNALWLDPFQTTPYDLYGYLVRRRDDEVESLLKLFTFHPLPKISEVMQEHNLNPPKRVAQHLLAYEVTALVHGHKIATETQSQHRAVYGGRKSSLPSSGVPQEQAHYIPDPEQTHHNNRPRIDVKLPRSLIDTTLPRLLYAAGLAVSVSDADRQLKSGGIYIGGSPGQKGHLNKGMVFDQLQFTPAKTWVIEANKRFLIDDTILLLRKGKHNIRCIEFINDEEWAKLGLEYPGQPFTGKFRKAMLRLNQMSTAPKKGGNIEEAGTEDGETEGAPHKISSSGPEAFLPTSQIQLQKLERRMRGMSRKKEDLRKESLEGGSESKDEYDWQRWWN